MPLTEEDLDGSSGVLFPFYDVDTNMLYVVGKVSLAWEGGDRMGSSGKRQSYLKPNPPGGQTVALGPWGARQGQGLARVAGHSPLVVNPAPGSPRAPGPRALGRHPQLAPLQLWFQMRWDQLVFLIRDTFTFGAEQVFIRWDYLCGSPGPYPPVPTPPSHDSGNKKCPQR